MPNLFEYLSSFLGTNVLLAIVGSLASMALISGIKEFISFFNKIRSLTLKIGAVEITVKPDNIKETLKEIDAKVRDLEEHPRIFLSHSYKDSDFALRLANDLRKEGIDVWLANEQLKAGDVLSKRIEDAIFTSQWVIIILSQNSVESNSINKELQLALKGEDSRQNHIIIPVVYKDVHLPPELEDRVFADFRESYETGFKFLLSSLRQRNTINVE